MHQNDMLELKLWAERRLGKLKSGIPDSNILSGSINRNIRLALPQVRRKSGEVMHELVTRNAEAP